jgi:hypothetical protein
MHYKHTENGLGALAHSLIQKHSDIKDAWEVFLDEARARYNPEDDGDGDEYLAEAAEIFEEKRAIAQASV